MFCERCRWDGRDRETETAEPGAETTND